MAILLAIDTNGLLEQFPFFEDVVWAAMVGADDDSRSTGSASTPPSHIMPQHSDIHPSHTRRAMILIQCLDVGPVSDKIQGGVTRSENEAESWHGMCRAPSITVI
jgi:hypothetical protein